MIDLSILIAFIPAAITLIVVPGPDVIYTLTRSVSDGREAGVMAALGSSSGSIVHTTAAVIGLSALLEESAVAFSVIKFAGVIYLVYTGIQTLRNSEEFDITQETEDHTPTQSYRSALMINVLNPKVALFFLAFLPQFIRSNGNVPLQIFILGTTFASIGFCYQAMIALSSARARRLITGNVLVKTILRVSSGCVLVGFGVKLALERRTT